MKIFSTGGTTEVTHTGAEVPPPTLLTRSVTRVGRAVLGVVDVRCTTGGASHHEATTPGSSCYMPGRL